MQTLDDKLARLDELRAQRKELDDEIAALFGMGKEGEGIVRPVEKRAYKKRANNNLGGWAKHEPKACCGSKGARHFKTCVNFPGNKTDETVLNPEDGPAVAEAPKARALSNEEYLDLRAAMQDKEFQSARYSLVNKLSPKEVNKAVVSKSYDEYIENME